MPFRCFALLSGSREIFIATGSPIDPLLHDRSSSSSLFHSFFFLLFLFPFFPFSSFLFARLVLVDATGQRDGNRVPSTTLFLISAVQLSRSTRNEERSEFIATGCIGRRLLTLVIPTPIGSRAITRNSDPKTFVRVRFEYCSGEDLPLKMSRGLWTHLINVSTSKAMIY